MTADMLAAPPADHAPLSEMAALGPEVLGRSLGNVLPAPAAERVPVAAFQSSI